MPIVSSPGTDRRAACTGLRFHTAPASRGAPRPAVTRPSDRIISEPALTRPCYRLAGMVGWIMMSEASPEPHVIYSIRDSTRSFDELFSLHKPQGVPQLA